MSNISQAFVEVLSSISIDCVDIYFVNNGILPKHRGITGGYTSCMCTSCQLHPVTVSFAMQTVKPEIKEMQVVLLLFGHNNNFFPKASRLIFFKNEKRFIRMKYQTIVKRPTTFIHIRRNDQPVKIQQLQRSTRFNNEVIELTACSLVTAVYIFYYAEWQK